MDIYELVIQDTLAFDLLVKAPKETIGLGIVEQNEDSCIESLVEALLPSAIVDNLAALTIDEVTTGIEAVFLGPDSFFDADSVTSFSQPEIGNLTAVANISFGGLYDDPIEYGDPLTDAYYWRQQQGSMSCAVVAQISVYESLTGQYISEYDASVFAWQNGWFDPVTGTPVGNTGDILDALGVPTYEMYGASFDILEQALAYGDKPIVGLDGSEIWDPMRNWDGSPVEQTNAGHAVWVTGIDYEWNGSIGIAINDSGTPNGAASVIDYYDFMNAWQDYGYFVSIADNPYT